MNRKSFLAAEWTLDKMAAQGKRGRLYLWTFTFADEVWSDRIGAIWAEMRSELRNVGLTSGLRVFEFHRGGHGLHVHVVTTQRVYAGDVWHCVGRQYGRVDVRRVKACRAKYVLKYLFKDARRLGPGRRVWDTFGLKGLRVQVRDIVMDSAVSRFMRGALRQVGEDSGRPLRPAERCEIVAWCKRTWAGQVHAHATSGRGAWPWAGHSLVSVLNNYLDGWLGDRRDEAPAWLRDGFAWVAMMESGVSI